MNVVVKGNISNKKKKYISQAAEYYASLLMSRRMISTIDLVVKVKPKLDKDVEGYCTYEDRENGIRYFEIELSKKLPIDTMLTVLAHEVTHLKQYAKGELKGGRVNSLRTIWMGKTYLDEEIEYWDHPWEIEAFGREDGLFIRYITKFGYPL